MLNTRIRHVEPVREGIGCLRAHVHRPLIDTRGKKGFVEMWIWPFESDFPVDDLLDTLMRIPLDAPDSESCLMLAQLFFRLGERYRAWRGASQSPDDQSFVERLLDAQRALRELADERGVQIPWLPMELGDRGTPDAPLQLIAGLVEALQYVARQPEFNRPAHGWN